MTKTTLFMAAHCLLLVTTLLLNKDCMLSAASDDVETSCETTAFPNHGVYDASIIYSVDNIITSPSSFNPPFFSAMDGGRNTFEYRNFSYSFLNERYGLSLDPATDLGNGDIVENGKAVLAAVRTAPAGEASTHQVNAIDSQHIDEYHGLFPMTNVAFQDDGYFVTFLFDYDAHGTYGGMAGKTIRAGDIVVAGQYNMEDEDGNLIDRLRYFADTPSLGIPFNGDLDASEGAEFAIITCRIESDLFGTGLTRGLGEVRFPPDGSILLDFRYVMRFPSRLDQLVNPDLSANDCRNLDDSSDSS